MISCPHLALWLQPFLSLGPGHLHQHLLSRMGRGWGLLQLPSTQTHSQAPGGWQPGFPPGPGQLAGEGCPVDSWLLPPLPSHPFKAGEKGAGFFLHSCFRKLPRGVWASSRLLAFPKTMNALLAAAPLHHLPILPGSSPSFS